MATLVRALALEAFCHATEDMEKVKQSMYNLIPEPFRGSTALTVENATGHFKNPISILRCKIAEQAAIAETVQGISRRISEIDKRVLGQSLNLRVDEKGVLHMRFDKQDLFSGLVTLSDTDDVIIVRVIPNHQALRSTIAQEAFRVLGLIL